MNRRDIILASTSPQRIKLMEIFQLKYIAVAPKLEKEWFDPCLELKLAIAKLAYDKASSIQNEFTDALIIACDTVVSFQGNTMGKPNDEREAYQMISSLAGKNHYVHSGLAVLDTKTGISHKCCVVTQVKMRSFTKQEATAYVRSKEWVGRAGGYAIQSKGMFLVDSIKGSWTNVVGLPMEQLGQILLGFGEDIYAINQQVYG